MALENGIRNLFFLSVFFFSHILLFCPFLLTLAGSNENGQLYQLYNNLFNLKFEASSYFLKSSSLHVCTEEGLQNSCDQ